MDRDIEFGHRDQVLRLLGPLFPRDVDDFFRYCLDHAREPLTVERVAVRMGIRRRALEYRMARAGLPPPSRVIAWCRVLHAAELLGDRRVGVDQAAGNCGYASAAALRKALQRAQLSVRRVRANGIRLPLMLLLAEIKKHRRAIPTRTLLEIERFE